MGNKVVNDVSNSTIHNPNSPLPEGWRWMRLGECKINPSRPRSFSRGSDAQTTFVPMAAVDEKTGTIARPEVVPYSKVSKGYTYFEENDVLFAKITPCMQNGKHAIARDLVDGVGFGSTEFHVIRPNEEVLPEWIHFFIRQPSFLQQATAYFVGAVGQQRVPEAFLADYQIPLPPLPEQKRIVAKVEESMKDIERARAACEKRLEAAKALPLSCLRHVFESEEAKKWERKRLGEVCEFSNGKFIRREEIKAQGIYPVYGANGLIGFADRILLDKSVIIVGRVGSCGEINKSSGPAWITDNTIVLAPLKDLDFDFLYLALKTLKFEELRAASVQPLITQSDLKAALISVPCLSEQKRIADELNDKIASVEKLKADIEKQFETIKALSQAIFRKAFRGEL